MVITVLLQGAASLARALRANSTLKELDLRWNEVGNDGARAIRDSLDTNRSLTSVKLSGNKVGLRVCAFDWTSSFPVDDSKISKRGLIFFHLQEIYGTHAQRTGCAGTQCTPILSNNVCTQ